MSEECGSGKEGKLVKLALNLTPEPSEALCGPAAEWKQAPVQYTHFNALTGVQTVLVSS